MFKIENRKRSVLVYLEEVEKEFEMFPKQIINLICSLTEP